MEVNYISVTEIAGDLVAKEQIDRLCHRYYWAGNYCSGKDVLEVACGSGQGLGYLAKIAKSIKAGDYSNDILNIAKKHYKSRIDLRQFSAEDIPFEDNTFDVILLFEAIYYLQSVEKFIFECRRILRSNGIVLIATANKDLFDFNPSPFSIKYYGLPELISLFKNHNFSPECFGAFPVTEISIRQRLFRPLKKIAIILRIMPKTMKGKKFFKKIFYGSLVNMPPEITGDMIEYSPPRNICNNLPNNENKVIYCAAKKESFSESV